jgi:Protein kinase domain
MPPSASERDERLDQILADYLHAVETGAAPDRAELVSNHPDLADDLASFFRNRDAMQCLAEPLKDQAPELAETLAPSRGQANGGTTIRYFGDYELLEEVARGGMGVVYRARQVSLNRIVAVKMILAGQLASAPDIARFRSEAEAAGNLDHPNILPIFEVNEHEGQQYFSMKMIEGGNLAGRVSELVSRPRAATALMARLARAVHFAHQRGLLHRDLKPANVLLDPDGTPYITDFGLVKRMEATSSLTQSGAIVGTPSYMSPEQARAEKQLTTGTDVYSLGAILYELITGYPPFRAATAFDTILQVIEKEPADPRSLNPKVDRDLAAIALHCMQKSPELRYESAAALADDLDRWLQGEPTRARPPSMAGLAWRWLKRNAATAAAIVALGAACGLMPMGLFLGRDQELLYPPDMGPLHPLRLIQITRHPVARIGMLAATAVLAIGIGWLVRLAARPRSMLAALGAAAVTALVATMVLFSMFGPVIGVMAYKIHGLRVHPVRDPLEMSESIRPEFALTQIEKDYLARLPAVEISPGFTLAPEDLRQRAAASNRFFAAIAYSWATLFGLSVIFLGLAIESTWAADHLSRSGRGLVTRVICYLELYPPAAALLILCEEILGMAWGRSWESPPPGGPTWLQMLTAVAIGAVWVGLAHVGVVRRWRPLVRISGYVGIALVAGVLLRMLGD